MKLSLLILLSTCLMVLPILSVGSIQAHATTATRFGAFLITTNPPDSFNYTAFCSDISAGCGASNSFVAFRGVVNVNGVPTLVSGSASMSSFRIVVYPDCTRYIFTAPPTSGPLQGGDIFGKACFGSNTIGTVVAHNANDSIFYGRDGTGSAALWSAGSSD